MTPTPDETRSPPERVSIRHRLEYAALRTGVTLLGAVPESVARSIGAGVGAIAGQVLRIRRAQVLENLRIAFPDRSEAWIGTTANATYRHLGREAAMAVRLASAEAAEIEGRTEVVGLEELAAALEEGVGVVVATGHISNMEVGAASLAARGFPMAAIARHQRNPLSDRWMRRTRERLGMRVLPKLSAAEGAGELLAEGVVLAVPADQDARARGVFAEFFGRPASTPRGPGVFAVRYRSPLFVGTVRAPSRSGGRYRVVLERLPDPGVTPGQGPTRPSRRQRVEALTQAFTDGIERRVREAPEQYFWFHRRWKTAPPPGTGDAPLL